MQKNWIFFVLSVALVGSSLFSFEEAEAQPKVGRKAAARYFQNDRETVRRSASESTGSGGGGGGGDQVLMLHVGTFIGSKSYQWKGSETRDNIGRNSYGVTYLMDEWAGMDLNLRADFNEYKIEDQRAVKLSVLGLLTFPRAETRFPIYFGIGAGPGIFFQQIPEESNLSFDYQLLVGGRFMNLFESGGFFVEFGLKNHLHLLSDGQFNGTTLTAGAIFAF